MGRTTATFKPFLQRLAAPTDTASLVLLRVSFGLLMLWEVIRFFYFGWVDELYAQPTFHFKYEWFTWVEAWPGYGMHLHFAALGVLAVLMLTGSLMGFLVFRLLSGGFGTSLEPDGSPGFWHWLPITIPVEDTVGKMYFYYTPVIFITTCVTLLGAKGPLDGPHPPM